MRWLMNLNDDDVAFFVCNQRLATSATQPQHVDEHTVHGDNSAAVAAAVA